MTLYDLLNDVVDVKKRFDFSHGFNVANRDRLETNEEKHAFDLIKNVCTMAMKVSFVSVEFSPCMIFEGKRTFALEDISEDDYTILLSLEHKKLPLNVRARVADILWTEKKKYQLALIAIDAYFELFNLFFKDDDWFDALDMIKRAACISAQLNKNDMHEKCCQAIYDHVLRLDGKDTQFLSISLIEFLNEHSFGDGNVIITILDNIIALNRDNPHKMERAFDLKFKYINKSNGSEAATAIRIEQALYFVDFAEQTYKNDKLGALKAESFFLKAILLFRNNGDTDSAEKTHRRLVEVQKDKIGAMTYYKQKIEASGLVKAITEYMDNLTFEECIVRLAQITHLYKKSEGQNYVIENHQKFIFSHMFGSAVIDQDGQTIFSLDPLDINDPLKDLELLDLHIHRKLYELEGYAGDLPLRLTLSYIRENFDPSKENLDFIFENNIIVPDDRKNIIEKGIRMALEGDYYTAIHVLAPQTGNIFRYIAKTSGALTVTLASDGTSKQKTLTSIFDLPELLDCYDNDIIFLFKGLLNEQAGANIRNEIAHGIMTEESGRSGASIYLICALIKLLVISSPVCLNMLGDNEKLKSKVNIDDESVKIIDEGTEEISEESTEGTN